MLQCFSLVYSYMLGLVLVLHAVILVWVMVLQVTVTVRHQTSAHAWTDKFEMSPATHTCGRMHFQMPADKLWDCECNL